MRELIVRRLVPTLGVVAVLAAGCGGWRDEQAAKVDTATVTMSSLRDEVTELADHPDLATIFRLDTTGGGQTDESATALVSWLNVRVLDLTVDEELARRGVAVDDAAKASAEEELRLQFQIYQQQLEASGTTPATPQSAEQQFDALSPDLRSAIVEREAARNALAVEAAGEAGTPLPATTQAWYDDNRGDFEQVCVSLIATQDQAGASAARARVESGTPFATVAKEDSGDASAADGGAAGCAFTPQLTPELATALTTAGQGGLVGPLQLNQSWFVFKVDTLGTAAFDDARASASSNRLAARQAILTAWFAEATPTVTVTPRLGTWDATNLQVVANPGPAPAPAAVQP